MIRFLFAGPAIFLFGSVWCGEVTAQSIGGRVLEDLSDHPVPAASVELLPAGGRTAVWRAISDEAGTFSLDAPKPGRYRLRVEALGYATVTTPEFDLLEKADTLQVEVLVAVEAVPLAPLVVVSRRTGVESSVRLVAVGYFDRRATWGSEGMGFGHFIERDELRRSNPRYLSDVLRSVPGVRIEGGGGRRQVITLRTITSDQGRCIPPVFINGAPFATGADANEVVVPADVIAVEVYPGMTAPPQFNRGQACGAIVVWTGG